MRDGEAGNGCWDLVDYYLVPIRHLFEIEGVTEICVNRYDEVFIEKNGEMMAVTDARFTDEAQVATLVKQIANALGQAIDKDTHPVLDARLRDGTRVCGVLHPVSPRGSCVTFRLFPKKRITAAFLRDTGAVTADMLAFLKRAVMCRYNMLVSGGTGSGKTTLLNALSGFIPPQDRVLTVEDTRELQIDTENHIAFEAPTRRQKMDGQTIDLAFLIKTCLRQNPTRIIVGEIRDAPAAHAFLQAINTGHSACTTIHANGPVDALTRIQTLLAGQGDLPFEVVQSQVRANLNLIVHTECTPNHGRRIVSITEIIDARAVELWRWSYRQGVHVRESTPAGMDRHLAKFGLETSEPATFGPETFEPQTFAMERPH